jgi:AcrR family transcriptional regulator
VKEDVKAVRHYRSPKREAQAAATRAEIADAAHRLFVARGYVSTTLADISEAAGVAVPTVKLTYGTKRAVLVKVWERAVQGGFDPRPLAEQDWFIEMLATPDPREHLRLKVAGSIPVSGRVAPLVEVIKAAAQSDTEIAALWDMIQTESRDIQRLTIQALQRKGKLRDGLTEDEATDLLYTLNHGTYHTLVERLGWSPQRYEHWLTQTLIDQLLAPPEEPVAPR